MSLISAVPGRCRTREERGASAVEFALVLPILLLLVFGIITWGLIFAAQISLNSAARDAARAAVVQPLNGTGLACADIATLARSSAGTIGLDRDKIEVTVTSPNGIDECTLAVDDTIASGSTTTPMCLGSAMGSGQLVVALSYEADSPVPLVPPSTIDLTANGNFQCEYS